MSAQKFFPESLERAAKETRMFCSRRPLMEALGQGNCVSPGTCQL